MASCEHDVDELLKRESKITSRWIAELLREKDPSFYLIAADRHTAVVGKKVLLKVDK